MNPFGVLRAACLVLFCLCLHLFVAAQTLPVPLQILPLPLPPGERSVSRLLQAPDGNAYGIVPLAGARWRFLRIAGAEVSEVKQVPGLVMPPAPLMPDGSQAWQWDFTRRQGYVLTSEGRLMSYGADGATKELGQVAGTRPFEEKTGFQLSRTLLLAPGGELYTAGDGGFLFRYTPGAAAAEKLQARLPAIVGREPWASLDAAAIAADGTIYGGTYDGYIFSFNPQTVAVVNFGKPFRAQRIATLFFRDNLLYGIGGGNDDLPRLFCFNTATHGFTLGGLFTHGVTPRLLNYYEPVGANTTDAAGNTYFATTGRLGGLFRWPASATTAAPR